MLPEVQRVKMPENVFPTKWQAVIFRNYGLINPQILAGILSCKEEILHTEAERLGLVRTDYNPDWTKKGYITLIRNNWFLLPYTQLTELLGIDKNRLDFILQNDDFLGVKLGEFKPECEKVVYMPLTQEQREQTLTIAQVIKKYIRPHTIESFDFFANQKESRDYVFYEKGRRIVHGYLSPCGDAFMENSCDYMPDALLVEYSKQGVNGVWFHGVLSTLSPYPFDKMLSAEYKTRRKNLNELISRCKNYGIKVYLYFNEPRALPVEMFGRYSHLIGHREKGFASLCFEQKQTREYLYNAVKDLLFEVPDLGGIITITMSENLTHCNYRPRTNCPICKTISPEQSAAAVNNVIQEAIKDSGVGAELIANLWGWSPFMEWTEKQTLRGVELLDKDISVMCVSEYDLEIEKGGVPSKIIDYSISNPGPSEITRKTLKKARDKGHKIYAKIQTNNSWECSAVPYLPVFDLLYDHLKNLSQIGVNDYMLTWTLGGYPSPMLNMVSEYVKQGDAFSLDQWYVNTYGHNATVIKQAVKCICDGFKEYPFSINSLYFSPKTLACANLWTLKKDEKQSCMVSYSYDDYEKWIQPYPIQVYLSQYEKLLKLWEQGNSLLVGIVGENTEDLKLFARGAYVHFKADYLQTKFSFLKQNIKKNRDEIKLVLMAEQANTEELLDLICRDGRIGFEASNHYFYTDRNLIEKLLNIQQLNKELV